MKPEKEKVIDRFYAWVSNNNHVFYYIDIGGTIACITASMKYGFLSWEAMLFGLVASFSFGINVWADPSVQLKKELFMAQMEPIIRDWKKKHNFGKYKKQPKQT